MFSMMTSPLQDAVQQCGVKMEAETSQSSAEINNQDVNVIVIIENLFDLGLEEVLQKVFLYLDPKSLKNCKIVTTTTRQSPRILAGARHKPNSGHADI